MTDCDIDFNTLQNTLNYTFSDNVYIRRALTHASANINQNERDYERLEFLGDRVVNLVVADLLFKTFPDEKEGALAKRHAALVRGETLAQLAQELDLATHVRLSESERAAGGAENENILADIMEAVTAAIYLDGGYSAAFTFVENTLGNRLHDMTEPPRDPKTTLQEWSQSRNLGLPVYELIGQDGPDHAPVFEIKVTITGQGEATATSTSKKRAEKEAAQALLLKIQN